MASPAGRVALVLTIAILIAMATAVFAAFDTGPGQQLDKTDTSTVTGLDGTQWADLGDQIGDNETVYETRGNAIQLTGAPDSEVSTDSDLNISTDDTWTVCTWTRVRNASADMTALSANGRLLLGYNGSQTNWTLWYFDDASTSSWTLNTTATTPTQGWHQLCGWRNGSELRMYVNASRVGSVADVTADNLSPAPVNSSNWNGSLEETRTFDDALNSSQRNATVTDPTAALANATRTSRLYYDHGTGTRVYVWFAETDATLTNGSWVGGFAEQTIPESGYKWRRDGPEVRATSGGDLDGAPAAWLDYRKYSETGSAFERFFASWSDAAGVAGALMLVIIAAGLLAALQRIE